MSSASEDSTPSPTKESVRRSFFSFRRSSQNKEPNDDLIQVDTIENTENKQEEDEFLPAVEDEFLPAVEDEGEQEEIVSPIGEEEEDDVIFEVNSKHNDDDDNDDASSEDEEANTPPSTNTNPNQRRSFFFNFGRSSQNANNDDAPGETLNQPQDKPTDDDPPLIELDSDSSSGYIVPPTEDREIKVDPEQESEIYVPVKDHSLIRAQSSFDKKAEEEIAAHVHMISGCRDSETSADVANVTNKFKLPNPKGKSGGACTSALLEILYENKHETDEEFSFKDVLMRMRQILHIKDFKQIPQLSSSRQLDIETKFDITHPGYNGKRRAVMIGINYVGQDGELKGCHNDVKNMKDYLMDVHEFKENDITVLMDDEVHRPPTKKNILDAFARIVRESESGDVVYIHYSGHGLGIKDDDNDEEDGMDETLVPSDFNKSGLIRDDDVLDTLVKPMARGVFVTAIMDCCHSGTILDLPYNFKADGQMDAMVPNNTTTSTHGRAIRTTTSRVSSVFSQSSEDSSQESVNLIPRIDSDPSLSAKDLSFENMQPPSIQVPRLPIAEWSGRLSFYREHRVKDIDGIYIQLYHAPEEFKRLIGKKLFLTWEKNHLTDQFIRQCKRNVFFSKVAKDYEPDLVLPKRLDGEMAVGPLESLAGSRSSNDIFCMLTGNVTFKPMKIVDGDLKTDGTLFINEEPIQISGVYYSVVKFLSPLSDEKDNDLYQVQHFNPSSGKLDGVTEVIRLPYKVYQSKTGILNSNNRKIETSKVNIDGYYIYGEYGNDGIFILKALDPRRAMILRPDTYIIKEKRLGRKFLRDIIWEDTPMSRGKMGTAIIDQTWATLDLSMKRWVEGKRFLVIHVIGDCVHNKRNAKRLIKGHFAFGSATVIRDPLTNELCFDIVYDQIHPHNCEGIVSGKVIRSSHLGDLQRGAINTKPVCDVIVDLETITKDYKFGDTNFTIFDEIQNQLQKKMGLYRVGNGRGVAAVTKTEKACQDAIEAFCTAIDKIEDVIANDYIAKKWFKLYPNYEACQRFRKLQKLGKALSTTMCPMGMDRKDWRYNQNQFQGNEVDDFIPNCMSFQNDGENNPRQCLYLLCKTFLDHGAGLWVIRTNQAGGRMKHIYPLAPTTSGFTGKQKVPTK